MNLLIALTVNRDEDISGDKQSEDDGANHIGARPMRIKKSTNAWRKTVSKVMNVTSRYQSLPVAISRYQSLPVAVILYVPLANEVRFLEQGITLVLAHF